MDNVKVDLLNMKVKSIKSELDFLKIDYEYKKKLIEDSDKDFLVMMNDILDENQELKEKYLHKEDDNKNKIIEEIINKAKKDEEEYQDNLDSYEDIDIPDTDITEIKKDKKVKKLYRKIVKKTHPDKICDDQLNNMYKEATDYYNNNYILGIYKICDLLNIEYDIEESEILFMRQEINNIKNDIGLIEGTYTWKWSSAPDDNIKKQIIIEFINMKLNS